MQRQQRSEPRARPLVAPVAELTFDEVRRELLARLRLMRSAGPRAALGSLRTELKVARTRRERRLAATRALWAQATANVGGELEPLAEDVFEIRKGQQWTRVIRERVMLNDAVSIEIAETKTLALRLLAAAGLPVPEWCEFDRSRIEPARRFMATRPGPFVVKPAASSAGRGITTNIGSDNQLGKAIAIAARFGSPLVIERQADGDVFRVLVLDDRILDVVRRRPPRLTGDGTSTARQLIAAENRRRLADTVPVAALPVDFDCLFTLEAQGIALGSVPPQGALFAARTVTNHNGSGDNETIRGGVGDALRKESVLAARCLGLRLAALDIVAPSLEGSLAECGGVILEVNPVPGLLHHYRVADPAGATNVAEEILGRLLDD